MTREEFKEYLDMIVDKAFKKGVAYEPWKFTSMEEAIKEAQEEILELKFK